MTEKNYLNRMPLWLVRLGIEWLVGVVRKGEYVGNSVDFLSIDGGAHPVRTYILEKKEGKVPFFWWKIASELLVKRMQKVPEHLLKVDDLKREILFYFKEEPEIILHILHTVSIHDGGTCVECQQRGILLRECSVLTYVKSWAWWRNINPTYRTSAHFFTCSHRCASQHFAKNRR